MKHKSRKGFTLAELLIVVAIIAVLVAVAIPIFSSQLEKARQAVDLQNARAIQTALVNAYNAGEIDLGKCGNGYGVWVLLYRDKNSGPSGYTMQNYALKDGEYAFCGADKDTIIKNQKINNGGRADALKSVLEEYDIDVSSVRIKCSKDLAKKKGWDWIVIQMVNNNGTIQSCMYSGFGNMTSQYSQAYKKNTDNLNNLISK